MPSPRNDPVSETVMPERLLSETGAAVLTERLGIRVFLGIFAPPSSWPRERSCTRGAFIKFQRTGGEPNHLSFSYLKHIAC